MHLLFRLAVISSLLLGSIVFGQRYEPLARSASRVDVSADGSRVAYSGIGELGVVGHFTRDVARLPVDRAQRFAELRLNHDGSILAAFDGAAGSLDIWAVDERRRVGSMLIGDHAVGLTFLGATPSIAVAAGGNLHVINVNDLDARRTVNLPGCSGPALAASHDGGTVAIGGPTLCTVDLATGVVSTATWTRILASSGDRIDGDGSVIGFHPSGKSIATTLRVRTQMQSVARVVLIDAETLAATRVYELPPTDTVRGVGWNSDGSALIVAADRDLLVLDAASGTEAETQPLTHYTVTDVAFHPSGGPVFVGHAGPRGYAVLSTYAGLARVRDLMSSAESERRETARVHSELDGDEGAAQRIAGSGTSDEVRAMLGAGVSPNLRDEQGVTLLMHAASDNTLQVVELLIAAGADATARDETGTTALHRATEGNDDAWIAAALVRAGADPHATDDRGRKPVDFVTPEIATQLLREAASLVTSSRTGVQDWSGDISGQAVEQTTATDQDDSHLGNEVDQDAVSDASKSDDALVWIEFTSDPTGLMLYVDDVAIGLTPQRVQIPSGEPTPYRIDGRTPDVHPFHGEVTASANATHPTYMPRFTDAERGASAERTRDDQDPPSVPQTTPPVARTQPTPTAPPPTYSSPTGTPTPRPGASVQATPDFVINFLANELELRDIACPPAPVDAIVCGITRDGEAMVSSLIDTIFQIYLQPASVEVRWRRDAGSGAFVGAYRRPEGVYVVSIAGTAVSIAHLRP